VGEVDQLENPVDEGQPDRAERVDGAERETVEARLGNVVKTPDPDKDDEDEEQDAERRQPRVAPEDVSDPPAEAVAASLDGGSGFDLCVLPRRGWGANAIRWRRFRRSRPGVRLRAQLDGGSGEIELVALVGDPLAAPARR
jgi:hypothetical protein